MNNSGNYVSRKNNVPVEVTPGPLSEAASMLKTDVCHNLYPALDGPGLAVAPMWPQWDIAPDGEPLCVARLGSGAGPTVFYCRGRNLMAREMMPDGVTPASLLAVKVATLEGDIYCAAVANGRLIVTTSEGVETFGRDFEGAWTRIGAAAGQASGIVLTACHVSAVTARVPERTLSQTYTNENVFVQKDTTALADDLAAAYLELSAAAAAASAFIQPLIARVKCYDAAGNRVSVSAPVLLTHPSSAPFGGSVELYSADRHTVNAYSLDADTWRIKIYAMGADNGNSISRAEIYVCPQIHPYDSTGRGVATLVRRSSSPMLLGRVSLPGLSAGLSAASAPDARARVSEMTARMDALERLVAVIHAPFEEGVIPAGGLTVEAGPQGDADRESRRLSSALVAGVDAPTESREDAVYTARSLMVSASDIFWGNLEKIRTRCPSPAALAASFAPGAWQGYVMVRYADGSTSVSASEGSARMPTAFGPMLYVPGADAVEVELTLSSGGKVYSGKYPLVASSSGRGALYLHPGNRPFMPGEVSAPYQVPAATVKRRRMPDAVGVSSVDHPGELTAVARTEGEVVALMPPMRSDSAWDFGRPRVLAATSGGIFSIKVATDRNSLAVNKLTPAGVDSGAVVTNSGSCVYAVAGNALLCLSGSSVTALLTDASGFVALGYERLNNSVIGVKSDGAVTEWLLDSRGRRIIGSLSRDEMELPGLRSLYDPVTGVHYLKSRAAVMCLGARAVASRTKVKWVGRMALGVPGGRLQHGRAPLWRLRLQADAGSFDGTLKLRRLRAGGPAAPSPDVSFALNGALRAAAARCFFLRQADGLQVELEGRVTGDFRFRGLMIERV